MRKENTNTKKTWIKHGESFVLKKFQICWAFHVLFCFFSKFHIFTQHKLTLLCLINLSASFWVNLYRNIKSVWMATVNNIHLCSKTCMKKICHLLREWCFLKSLLKKGANLANCFFKQIAFMDVWRVRFFFQTILPHIKQRWIIGLNVVPLACMLPLFDSAALLTLLTVLLGS